MNLLAPFGFYGWGNIGDEATLQGFARLVERSPQRLRAWFGSRDPKHTRQVEPAFNYFKAVGRDWRRWWAYHRSSAVVVVGGTPIMDCLGDWPLCEVTPLMEDAHRRGRPVAFVGVGTERLQREESRRIIADRLAPCVRQWTVRSRWDEARLIECGVAPERVEVAADLAWLLNPVSPEWGKQRLRAWGLADHPQLLGVNILGEKTVLAREPQLFEKLARFLDALVEGYGVFVLFLANEVREGDTFDKVAALKTRAAMKHQSRAFLAPNEYLAPQQMMSLIAGCHATVSMRYHFCLFSALQGVPFIALKRSDKVIDLCGDLGWPFGAELNGVSVADLVASFEALDGHRAGAVNGLEEGVAALRERAARNEVALKALLNRALAQTA
ncbi:MAG: polysaccharide pyruvyl transferase family protein [Gemmataceae bacterium]|nr:polysaccharide pyruvyl transferase family protein [Gemmataceae bacterium]